VVADRFGTYGATGIMYAPVVFAIPDGFRLPGTTSYMQTILDHGWTAQWMEAEEGSRR
jgi:glutathione S-transferase